MIEADAVVAGAGPAGAALALNLAPLRRVLVLDVREPATERIGESLVPAARRLLADMGLWDAFQVEGHAPCHGASALWGAAEPASADGLRDPDGPGWHLDRPRFDRWLRAAAVSRGAALLVPARLGAVARDGDGWRLELLFGGRRLPARARLLVDAGGRGAALARQLGARRIVQDRLVCGWIQGSDGAGRQAGLRHIEAEAEGWWYSAPLPAGRRVVAFHTDADLPAAAAARSRDGLLDRLAGLEALPALLAASGFAPDGAAGFCAAHGAALMPPAGDGWMAVGDAALAFDPLSSQGIFNALYTGLAAAEAADRHLAGDEAALAGYDGQIRSIRDAYRTHLQAWYGLEMRWPDQPFWHRRHAAQGPSSDRPEQEPFHAATALQHA